MEQINLSMEDLRHLIASLGQDDEVEALVGGFAIGPQTLVGRVIALKVLYGGALSFTIQKIRDAVFRFLGRWGKIIHYLVGSTLNRINLRRPWALGSVCLAAWWLSRVRDQTPLRAMINQKKRYYKSLMKRALTYEEWHLAAKSLDIVEGGDNRERDGKFFDIELVESRLKNLRAVMARSNIAELEYHLRAHLIRNLGNVCNPELYRSRLVAPKVIREYLHEVNFQLKYICNYDQPDLTLEQKLVFMQETRHAFGRTALLLSGGATLGLFHLGVVKTLVYHRILPRVVAGSSAGSIISSFIATKTDDELEAFFQQPLPEMKFFTEVGSLVRFAIRWLRYGRLHDVSVLRKQLRDLIGDYTFQEAYDLSGRILGVSISSVRPHEPPMLLNYLTSPHVIIWSAVCASCSFPGLFEAQELLAKDPQGKWIPYHWERSNMVGRRWRDGSLEEDLPFLRVKELFNVNHFIVSQANPHIAPFLRLKELIYEKGGKTARTVMHLLELEVKHRLKQALEMGIGGKGMSSLWSQEWEGDITIVMPATWEQMRKVIANPTREDVMSAVLQGERLAWGKVSSIVANCSIEMTLDECVQELRARKKAQQHQLVGSFMRQLDKDSRIPSWNVIARPASSDSMASSSDEGSSHSGRGGGGGGGNNNHHSHCRQESNAPFPSKGLGGVPLKGHGGRGKKRRARQHSKDAGVALPATIGLKGGADVLSPVAGVFDVTSPVDSGSPRAVPSPIPAVLLGTPWPSTQVLSTQEEEAHAPASPAAPAGDQGQMREKGEMRDEDSQDGGKLSGQAPGGAEARDCFGGLVGQGIGGPAIGLADSQ